MLWETYVVILLSPVVLKNPQKMRRAVRLISQTQQWCNCQRKTHTVSCLPQPAGIVVAACNQLKEHRKNRATHSEAHRKKKWNCMCAHAGIVLQVLVTLACVRRRSGQSVTASDFGSNGPRFESGRGTRCVESLDKGSLLPLSQGEAFTLASISYLAILVNPLWGHRSISIDSDLGALQPYFLVVMVTPASPFFACMQLNDKPLLRWRFEKPLSSIPGEDVVLVNLWTLRFPTSLRPAERVVRSSCLERERELRPMEDERFASGGRTMFSILGRQCRLQVYLSIWAELSLPGEAIKPSQWNNDNLESNGGEQHWMRFWRNVRIVPNDVTIHTTLPPSFSVSHDLVDLSWVISEPKWLPWTFGMLCHKEESASFFWPP